MHDHPPDSVINARRIAAAELRAAGIDSAALDARVLLAHVLDTTQTGLILRDPELISADLWGMYQTLVEQRATGVPVAYLIGEREFMGLDFNTNPGVLVPRPDTEPLVEWALQWIDQNPNTNIVDIGTGSGAIAISLTHHATSSWLGKVLATDVSEQALEVAKSNADRLLSTERRKRISFLQGSLTSPISQPVDMLLTNLPYLTPEQIGENTDLRHEPTLALDGGADGLNLVREVIQDLPRALKPYGAVGFELDPSQIAEVQRLLKDALPDFKIDVVFDLAGDERHVIAYAFPNPDHVQP